MDVCFRERTEKTITKGTVEILQYRERDCGQETKRKKLHSLGKAEPRQFL